MRLVLLFVLLGLTAPVLAQPAFREVKKKHKTVVYRRQHVQTYPVTLGWISPLGWHMGVYAQTDLLWRSKTVNREVLRLFRPRVSKTHVREIALQPGFMWYAQPQFHTGTALYANMAWRRMRKQRVSYQVAPGLAWLNTWYNGPVYSFNESGEMRKRSLATRSYLTPGINFSLLAKHGHRRNNGVPLGYVDLMVSSWFPSKWGGGSGWLVYWGAGWRMSLQQWKGKKA